MRIMGLERALFQIQTYAPIWRTPCIKSGVSRQVGNTRSKENMEMKKNQKGFSLIELLIVVAIILIIAAIAIPNLLRARMAANESSAVGTLRSMNTANATYETLYNYSFANSLPVLGGATVAAGVVAPCTAANLIDNVLSATNTPSKSGYNFSYAGARPNVADTLCNSDTTYTITAVPITVGGTGNRSFFTDQSGIIRQNPNGVVPTVADLPLN
jgi:type IV pilus assembly protein PilA